MAVHPDFKNILFVLNPISGDISKEEVKQLTQKYCETKNLQSEIYETTGQDDENALQLLLQKEFDLVVAIGGDGTVSLVAKVLNHSDVPLGILPLGSGNGLSKDLGIPQDIAAAINIFENGKIKAIDSLEVNGHIAFHLCDLGFNARIVKLFCEGETRGPGVYAKIAFQEYMTYEPFTYQIKTDQETFAGPAFMLTIANANAFGSNAAINPDGEVDDGFFEICLIEPFPTTAALGILYDLYTNAIQKSVYSRVLKCRSAVINKAPGDILQIDGEPVLVGDEINIKLHQRSLKVLVPATE